MIMYPTLVVEILCLITSSVNVVLSITSWNYHLFRRFDIPYLSWSWSHICWMGTTEIDPIRCFAWFTLLHHLWVWASSWNAWDPPSSGFQISNPLGWASLWKSIIFHKFLSRYTMIAIRAPPFIVIVVLVGPKLPDHRPQ